jgi:UDP-N-acetylmuramate dehydrogenase
MNAGAYGGEMSQIVSRVLAFDGETAFELKEFGFSYRRSIFTGNKNHIVLEASLSLTPDDPALIKSRMDALLKARNDKQPVAIPSAGSFFKRPQGYYAAAMIEQCGLKGKSVGGAKISEKHAGFIINTGGASCKDVLLLAALVREKVFKQTGVELEPEVRLLGDIQWSF